MKCITCGKKIDGVPLFGKNTRMTVIEGEPTLSGECLSCQFAGDVKTRWALSIVIFLFLVSIIIPIFVGIVFGLIWFIIKYCL